MLPLPGWLPEDTAMDHWEAGHRGLIASRLIAELSATGGPSQGVPSPLTPLGSANAWRRLRRRFKPEPEAAQPGSGRTARSTSASPPPG
jgi:hypothetical protein